MWPKSEDELKVAVIGLGYVGLPLAAAFAKTRSVIGFDVDKDRIDELKQGHDVTGELSEEDLFELRSLKFTTEVDDLRVCNCYIITVPTPVDSAKRPDLSPLLSATKLVAGVISQHDIVVFESTVYPGATEEDCGQLITDLTGMECAQSDNDTNNKFFLGYSPERINPGDPNHSVKDIVKVTSGCTPKVADLVDDLYATVIRAGTYKAESIKVAEAAKVIENIQRDVNIALINELSLIFEKLGLDTNSVLKAAGTKWNFLNFKPGLVGGHCIGVDPYYLTYKAVELGHNPELILAGRRLNDSMADHIVKRIVKGMIEKKISPLGAKVLVLGLTFKENCPDVRNSKVFDLVQGLGGFGCSVEVFDPHVLVTSLDAKNTSIKLIDEPNRNEYDVLILAVAHSEFLELGISEIKTYGVKNHFIFDVKSAFPPDLTDGRL